MKIHFPVVSVEVNGIIASADCPLCLAVRLGKTEDAAALALSEHIEAAHGEELEGLDTEEDTNDHARVG